MTYGQIPAPKQRTGTGIRWVNQTCEQTFENPMEHAGAGGVDNTGIGCHFAMQ